MRAGSSDPEPNAAGLPILQSAEVMKFLQCLEEEQSYHNDIHPEAKNTKPLKMEN